MVMKQFLILFVVIVRTPTLLVKVHGIIKYISIIHKCSNTQMSACKMAKLW